MILRRFIKHVSDQNWFAVGLDVVVVIVGIFLGMQVTDWNEKRKDNERTNDYLARLHADLTLSIESTERTRTFITDNTKRLGLVLDSLLVCELADEDRDAFANGLNHGGKLIPATYVRGTFDELLSSGRLGLVGNPDIINLLNEADREIKYQAGVWSSLQARTRLPLAYIDQTVLIRIKNKASGFSDAIWADIDLDFPALCEDRRFKAAVNTQESMGYTNIDWLARNLRNFRAAREAIAKELSSGK